MSFAASLHFIGFCWVGAYETYLMSEDQAVRRRSPWFIVAISVGALLPIAFALDFRSAPLFAFGILLWSLAPLAVAWLIFKRGAHAAAWGWLLAVVGFCAYVWLSVTFVSTGSTSSLAFLWAPVWAMLIAGPIGAFIGVVIKRRLQ